MRRVIWATSYLAGGIAAGALSAYVLIQQAGVEPAGTGTPWYSRAAALTETGDHYVRAHYLLAGRLPHRLQRCWLLKQRPELHRLAGAAGLAWLVSVRSNHWVPEGQSGRICLGRKSVIWGVWVAPGARESLQKCGG